MFKKSFLYLLIAASLMFGACLITGKVVDENGTGLGGVTVELSGDLSRTTTTDSNGKYRFGDMLIPDVIPAGSYTVTPSKAGYSFTPNSDSFNITVQTLGDSGDVPWPVFGVNFTGEEGLVAYYPFNGNANDESGNGNHGTVYGATLTGDRFGNPNSAYDFDGVDDYIDIGNDSSLKPGLPVTISAWVRLTDGSNYTAFTFDNNFENDLVYGFELVAQGDAIAVSFRDGGGTSPASARRKIANASLTVGRWYHVAGVIRGATDMDLYLDGVNAGGTYSGTGGALAYNDGPGTIGTFDSSGFHPPYHFRGKADEIRFYNRAFSENEITDLYNLAK